MGFAAIFFFFFEGDNFPSEKRSTLKGNNLLPLRSKFFPFIVDPFFLKGGKTILTDLPPLCIHFP